MNINFSIDGGSLLAGIVLSTAVHSGISLWWLLLAPLLFLRLGPEFTFVYPKRNG